MVAELVKKAVETEVKNGAKGKDKAAKAPAARGKRTSRPASSKTQGAAAIKKLRVGRGKPVQSDEDDDDFDPAAISGVMTQEIAADGKAALANATAQQVPSNKGRGRPPKLADAAH